MREHEQCVYCAKERWPQACDLLGFGVMSAMAAIVLFVSIGFAVAGVRGMLHEPTPAEKRQKLLRDCNDWVREQVTVCTSGGQPETRIQCWDNAYPLLTVCGDLAVLLHDERCATGEETTDGE